MRPLKIGDLLTSVRRASADQGTNAALCQGFSDAKSRAMLDDSGPEQP